MIGLVIVFFLGFCVVAAGVCVLGYTLDRAAVFCDFVKRTYKKLNY